MASAAWGIGIIGIGASIVCIWYLYGIWVWYHILVWGRAELVDIGIIYAVLLFRYWYWALSCAGWALCWYFGIGTRHYPVYQ